MGNKHHKSKTKSKSHNSSIKVTSGMDSANKEAMKVLKEKGEKKFIEHVFTGENNRRLTYAGNEK